MGGPLKVLPEGKNKKLRIHFTFQNHKAIRKYAIDVFPFFQHQFGDAFQFVSEAIGNIEFEFPDPSMSLFSSR